VAVKCADVKTPEGQVCKVCYDEKGNGVSKDCR
jgi:hypothetical protein